MRSANKTARLTFIAALILVSLLAASTAAKESATDIARRVATLIAAQHHAHPQYSYRMVRSDLYVQGKNSTEERYDARVFVAGDKIARIEYLAGMQSGRMLSEAELKRIGERADEARRRQTSFRQPYDLAALEEYDFASEGEETLAGRRCARIRFAARVRDTQHSNGVMWVDRKTFNLVKLSYQFSRNPAGVEQSLVEVTRAPVLGDLWSSVRTYQKLDRGEKGYDQSAFVNSEFREP